jgi:aminopeptidase N
MEYPCSTFRRGACAKQVLCFLLFLLPFTGQAFQFPSPDRDKVDIKHYTFRIELNDTTDLIGATAEITFVSKKGVADLELDLTGKNSAGKGMQVHAVTRNASVLKFTQQNDKLKITLDAAPRPDEPVTITVRYSGIPADGLIISKNKFGDRTFFADNWPNRGHHWVPAVDHPADKASVDFIIVAPVHYDVVANGVRVEESYLGKNRKLTHYSEEIDIPVKVMVIGVARFAMNVAGIVNHIPVESWVYPQNREDGFHDMAFGPRILDFFSSHVGPYPYKKLANVQSKTTFGGLENASAIFYFENMVDGKADHEDLMAHEIAHQWFGDSASEREWAHVWLSEGFATYFALLYSEFTHGVDKRQAAMIKDREQVIAFARKSQVPIVMPEVTDLMQLLNVNSYQKGGWVLHMLRQETGDANFWAGVREYYRTYRDGNALTDDLRRIMEKNSGKNLAPFFDQWVYKAGHPVLDVSWTYNEQQKNIQLSVNQLQKGSVFDVPLEIGVYDSPNGAPRIEKVQINKTSQVIAVPAGAKPLKIELDPRVNLLFEGK